MADVRPFSGLRFNSSIVENWGAALGPPYDIIDDNQRKDLLQLSPYQISHIETAIGSTGAADAAKRLNNWKKSKVLIQNPQEAFYLAEHDFVNNGHLKTRQCIFATVRLTPWEHHDVRPHEWTMPGPKSERLMLRSVARADISPIMSVIPDHAGLLADTFEKFQHIPPILEGSDANGDVHRLRIIDDVSETKTLAQILSNEPIYIADGHHRYESALDHCVQAAALSQDEWTGDEPENFVLMGLIPANDPGLVIGPTHRIIHAQSVSNIKTKLAVSFNIRPSNTMAPTALIKEISRPDPETTSMAVLGLDQNTAYILTTKKNTSTFQSQDIPNSWNMLDTAILQFGILEPLFGINENTLASGKAVTYSHDVHTVLKSITSGKAKFAFLLNPPTLNQVISAADSRERMPQKSTYFTPKLPTGIVLHNFDQPRSN